MRNVAMLAREEQQVRLVQERPNGLSPWYNAEEVVEVATSVTHAVGIVRK
jgi:hypothetical protein